MEKIATATYSFEKLRKAGYVYVDKTDMLWRLVSETDDSQFFIARPRRFGKSLMLSTLKCIFEGRRELFRGLKIEKKRYDWKKYPVVMLDMSKAKGETPDELKASLDSVVDGIAATFGLKIAQDKPVGTRFGLALDALYAKRGEYVVLVDEYDVPLQGFLRDRAAVKRVRSILHDFYVQLKAHSGEMRFLMMTGVTKLTKLSVFSGLNNPEDLTMDHPEYAGLLGYTPKEIEAFYPKRLDALARKLKTDRKGAMKRLMDWYDSYRFCPDSTVRVCNPISIAKSLRLSKIQSYWVRTATASLVMERLEETGRSPQDFEGCEATAEELDVCDALELPVKALMYQSGYLTIKGVTEKPDDDGQKTVVLGIPNLEIRRALRTGWFDSVVKVPATEFDALVDVAKKQVAAGDVDALICETLYRIYAKIPPEWKIRNEADVKRHFRLFMEMLGAKVAAEEGSAFGYADAIIETRKAVWVFEFKFNKSANAAVRQIREKGYADPYKGDKRPVTLVGINFRAAKRNIDEPVMKRFSEANDN